MDTVLSSKWAENFLSFASLLIRIQDTSKVRLKLFPPSQQIISHSLYFITLSQGLVTSRWCGCCWTRGRTGACWTPRGCPPPTTPRRRSASPSSASWSGPSSSAQSAPTGSTARGPGFDSHRASSWMILGNCSCICILRHLILYII